MTRTQFIDNKLDHILQVHVCIAAPWPPPAVFYAAYSAAPLIPSSSSTHGQLPFRSAILPSSGSQRSRRKRTSGLMDDDALWIRRAARRGSPIRPCSE
ncbi:hypothetical protein DPMN_148394 [Dreissena polymorpha]|uniref:Uncharacterized protein n=1 Tax=Dreissena polymorpha TaxID=45954 RepID=A0A9D4J061_DREPO|nr:hypothetical protein DPMN_148394 [Dreissena polymorpha]